MKIYRLMHLRMINVSDKCCRENQDMHFMFNIFFFLKSCRFWGNVKNAAERGRPQMTIWRMRISCWITKTTNTLRMCNTFRSSTTTMVARTLLNVTLYVHCLSCSLTFARTVRLVVLCKSKKEGWFVCRHRLINDILRACYVIESAVFHMSVCVTCGWADLCEVIRRRWQLRFVLWRNVWREQHCCWTGKQTKQFVHVHPPCECVCVCLYMRANLQQMWENAYIWHLTLFKYFIYVSCVLS
jgi:hypothetical protein